VRKAVWGTIALGVSALAFGTPLREDPVMHRVVGLFSLVGYILISLDPPVATVQQRNLMIGGVIASVIAVLLFSTGVSGPVAVLGRLFSVASLALPVWLFAGPMRSGFIASAVLAAVTIVDALENAGGVATSLYAYVAALSCWGVAVLMVKPALLTPGDKKPPRVVVASNIVSLSPAEKERALARLEARFRNGEIPEHVYLDKKQELES
jgi:hypothetical protein